jgi:hypothetical protein
MQVLHNFMSVPALPVGMHDNDASLSDNPLQMIFDSQRSQSLIGVSGHNIPENELKTKGAGHADGVVVEFPIGWTKQCRVMTILGFEQTNGSENFSFLLVR